MGKGPMDSPSFEELSTRLSCRNEVLKAIFTLRVYVFPANWSCLCFRHIVWTFVDAKVNSHLFFHETHASLLSLSHLQPGTARIAILNPWLERDALMPSTHVRPTSFPPSPAARLLIPFSLAHQLWNNPNGTRTPRSPRSLSINLRGYLTMMLHSM
ncbi:hypothetical protein BS47DRAFT_487888 [Hydnum rufescens UP504]|uniref:Uncharacterized protein n=1 Tax=Hydnum rufescens UP504 TaxID=1448309 RepID=A0A9P6AHJ2_9AGAM|nr:hypothetical protein BS47DRAFT_487888 [Hydnum rufescens UP504]